MDSKLIAKYLTSLKERTSLTYEAIAEKSGRSESTVKNLCLGRNEDPRLDTVAPIIFAMGGSIDEMYTGKKDAVKEISISSIKEIYEQQLLETSKMSETHINNIRAHYEQHRQDFKESFDGRIADKIEIIESQKERIKSLENQILSSRILSWVCIFILVGILILEVINPELGWIRF